MLLLPEQLVHSVCGEPRVRAFIRKRDWELAMKEGWGMEQVTDTGFAVSIEEEKFKALYPVRYEAMKGTT